MTLTPKQKRFCEEYIKDLNAKQAGIRSGYSIPTAEQQASRLLSNVKVQEYLQKLRSELSTQNQITQDRILSELAKVAFCNVTDIVSFGSGGVTLKESGSLAPEVTAAIESVKVAETERGSTVAVKMHNKIAALSKLSDILGLTSDWNMMLVTAKKYGFECIKEGEDYKLIKVQS